jgi:eukaryotic-like serine/threonine-protein kinase
MPEPSSSQVPVGTVLEGKFRVTQEIGRGGMAAVYEAENIDIGKRVAVKILSADLITSRIVRERFMREARAAAAIHSPYICEVYDSGMFHDRPFLVMELLQGESLYDRMTRVRQLRVSTTMKIMRHVVRGLAKAHEVNVVHRDLKPENIFLTRDTEGLLLAKIVDFGLAKFYESRDGEDRNVRLTREGALFGTPAYMSPEQARGQGEVDHRADLWALGCIVYECLTGRTVWDVQQGVAMILAQIAKGVLPDPRAYRPDLPETFSAWFQQALHPELSQRFPSARVFLESLELALPGADDDSSPSDRAAALASLADIPEPAVATSAAPPAHGAPAPSANAGRAIIWFVGIACIAFAGYVGWLYLRGGDGQILAMESDSPNGPSTGDHAAPLEPAEKGPGAELIGRGQTLLRADKDDEAFQAFEAARGENPNVAGSLLNHSKVAREENETGPCDLTGIGRPRPFEVAAPASHARITLSKDGFLAAWTDAHQDERRRNVYAALLDDALRRVGPVRNVTPEASSAIEPSFIPMADGYAVVYWDSASAQPGVYVRAIEWDGRIKTPARLLSTDKKDKYFPSVTPHPGGELIAVWSEQAEAQGKLQLVARKLDRELVPTGDPVHLTALVSGSASQPYATVYGEWLYVAYRFEPSPHRSEIRLLRARLDEAARGTAPPAPATGNQEADQAVPDRAVGQTIVLRSHPKQAEPSLACDADGCLVTWDDETAGAYAAYVPHGQDTVLWHREFSTKGKRPVLAQDGSGHVAAAYFAGDRLLLALVTRDGINSPSVISKVSGFQPGPKLVSGRTPGEWLISWRDFEAGHLEIFVARAQCSIGQP